MKLLRSTFLLAYISISQLIQAQQNQIFLNASVLSQPDEFHFVTPHSNLTTYPAFTLNAGYTSDIKSSNFIWEGQLSFMNAKAELYENNFIPPSGGSDNDSFIPDQATWQYISRTLGIKGGFGYQMTTRDSNQRFGITAGFTGYIPFLSKTKLKKDDADWEKQPLYTGDSFKYGILYGFYLKPTYQLAFGENSQWALNIFGEANLLWRNATDYGNPLFMSGGGLGVSYTL